MDTAWVAVHFSASRSYQRLWDDNVQDNDDDDDDNVDDNGDADDDNDAGDDDKCKVRVEMENLIFFGDLVSIFITICTALHCPPTLFVFDVSAVEIQISCNNLWTFYSASHAHTH